MFLEAVTWVVGGFECLQEFRRIRKRAPTNEGTSDKRAAFHDGTQVLPEVKLWYDHLRQLVRKDDKTTGKILDLIDSHLLQGDPLNRYDSKQLYEHLDQILLDVDVSKQHADERVAIEFMADRMKMQCTETTDVLRDDLLPGRGASEILELYSDAQHLCEEAMAMTNEVEVFDPLLWCGNASRESFTTFARFRDFWKVLDGTSEDSHNIDQLEGPQASPVSTPTVLDSAICEVCGNVFTGVYRRGNLSRHKRQKHGLVEGVHPGEERSFEQELRQSDARLKHYRQEALDPWDDKNHAGLQALSSDNYEYVPNHYVTIPWEQNHFDMFGNVCRPLLSPSCPASNYYWPEPMWEMPGDDFTLARSPISVCTPSDEPWSSGSSLRNPNKPRTSYAFWDTFEEDARLEGESKWSAWTDAARMSKQRCGKCEHQKLVRYKGVIDSVLNMHKNYPSLSTEIASQSSVATPPVQASVALKQSIARHIQSTASQHCKNIVFVLDPAMALSSNRDCRNDRTAVPLETRLIQTMDQYLSGRQDTHITLVILTDGDWEHEKSVKMERLMSQFWTSPKRMSTKDNLSICFITIGGDTNTLEKMERYL